MLKMPLKLENLEVKGKTLLIREDFNVPMAQGKIAHDARIRAALPTLQWARDHGAAILLMSHLGRPEAGIFDVQFSLKPVAQALSSLLGVELKFFPEWERGVDLKLGEIGLCENVRFSIGEEEDDSVLAHRMAALCDIFVMDAFAVAHRCQASTVSVARYAKVACAGPLLIKELEALNRVLLNAKAPVVAVVGGAKVSSKLALLEALLEKVDILIVGGGIANTFLSAAGMMIGQSLHEPSLVPVAARLLSQAQASGKRIILPEDVVVAPNLASKDIETKVVEAIGSRDAIYDVGPKTSETIAEIINSAATILWNGPLGVFEQAAFSQGTIKLAQAIANSKAFSVAGGGDTLAAIDMAKVEDKIGYISTGGGAFLEYMEGKELPAIAALVERM